MEIVDTFITKDEHMTKLWLGNSHIWIGQEFGSDYDEVYFHFDDIEILITKLRELQSPDVQGEKND